MKVQRRNGHNVSLLMTHLVWMTKSEGKNFYKHSI